MTSATTLADSDSVNLGSNPSSPATASIDISATSPTLMPSERSEFSERTAHIGRTQVGTLMHPDQIVDLRRGFTTLRNKLHPQKDIEKQTGMNILVGRLEEMLKRPDDEELH